MSNWRIFLKPQQRIVVVYLIAASLWILFSDSLLLMRRLDSSFLASLSMLKGLAFVGVTSAVLYTYLQREFNKRFDLEIQLRGQIEQATQTSDDLESSEQRFRKAVEEAPNPTIIIAEDGEVISISRSWLEITGYTYDQLQTVENWTQLAYGQSWQRVKVGIDKLFDLGKRVDEGEFKIRCADGTERTWTFSSTPLGRLPDGRRMVISVATDITERVQAEEQLRIKDSAIASSITPIALADLEGKLTYVNAAFVKLWKLDDAKEALGQSILAFWQSSEAAQAIIEALMQQSDFRGELTAKLADGSTAEVELTASLVRNDEGNPLCLMGSFKDVTHQRQMEAFVLENERLKARFQKERERNALVQRIITALSHDLRTPLTVISSSKDLLSQYRDHLTPEKRHEKLESIGRQVQFALEMLEDTVNMARGSTDDMAFRPTAVNLPVLCQISVDEAQIADGNQHRLRFEHVGDVQTVLLDEVLVSRILLNLLSNAIKYSPKGSEITLQLDRQDDRVLLRVIDQGTGIAADDVENIFKPFFRAKDVMHVNGTGLGLSIVQDCVRRHQGQIHVESTPGQGSVFTVKLPLEETEAPFALA